MTRWLGKKQILIGKFVKITDDGFLLVETAQGKLKVKASPKQLEFAINIDATKTRTFRCVLNKNKERVLLNIGQHGGAELKSKTNRVKAWSDVNARLLEDSQKNIVGKSRVKYCPTGNHLKAGQISQGLYDVIEDPASAAEKRMAKQPEVMPKGLSIADENAWTERQIRKNIAGMKKIKTIFEE